MLYEQGHPLKSKLEKFIITILFLGSYYGILYHPNLPVFMNEFNSVDGSIYVARFVDVCISLLIFFSVGFYLVPNILLKKKMTTFILLSIILVGMVSFLEYQLDHVILKMFNLPTDPNAISDKMLSYYRRKSYDFPIIPVNMIITILALLYGLSRDWINKSRTESKLIHEKMRADIDFLRSQINPHFFFNALNNIYAITQRNDDDEAGRAIMKLSDMMRYMIYDSNVSKISLEDEIQQIENARFHHKESIKKHSGIGLDNVKKRLELLYPQKYDLQISETEQRYIVNLTFDLEE